jgi:hypothetical protein
MVMKRFFVFYLFVSVGCLGLVGAVAVASDGGISRHMPTDKMLEFSLSRLQESVEKTAQKNDRLAFENEILRKNIDDLLRQREVLAGKRSALVGGNARPYREEKETRLSEAIDPEGRKKRTQELLGIFQRDIARLSDEIRILENSLDGAAFNAHKRLLLEKKESTRKSFGQLEKRLQLLQQKNKAPAETVRLLKQEQTELVGEVRALEGRL